jgi:TRAP-type C4-dicarboxylate transport system permease large subunit
MFAVKHIDHSSPFRGILPFLILLLIVLVVIIYSPELTLRLPSTVYGT